MYIPTPVKPHMRAHFVDILGKTMRENVQDVKITQTDEEGRWSKIEFEVLDDSGQKAALVARRFLDALYAAQRASEEEEVA